MPKSLTTSFPVDPQSEGYNLELERLRLQFKSSQEDPRREQETLRVERERSAAQEALFEREQAMREASHRRTRECEKRGFASIK